MQQEIFHPDVVVDDFHFDKQEEFHDIELKFL
jgi:hypothetical protein